MKLTVTLTSNCNKCLGILEWLWIQRFNVDLDLEKLGKLKTSRDRKRVDRFACCLLWSRDRETGNMWDSLFFSFFMDLFLWTDVLVWDVRLIIQICWVRLTCSWLVSVWFCSLIRSLYEACLHSIFSQYNTNNFSCHFCLLLWSGFLLF